MPGGGAPMPMGAMPAGNAPIGAAPIGGFSSTLPDSEAIAVVDEASGQGVRL